MEMRTASGIVVLLISLVIIEARTVEPVSTDEGGSSACDKCLMVSRKAEAALNSQKLFNEVYKLAGEACQVFPIVSQIKCLNKSRVYLHEARRILLEFFREEHLCNNTGLCAKSEFSVNNSLDMNGFQDELRDERACTGCRKAVKELFNRLKNPKMRSKIVDALLDYCEEAEEEEDQCKQVMYQYGPIILHKLEKFKPTELCSMLGMCDEEMVMKI